MKKFFKNEALAIGLAMFSMFFGAGNIIYPLAVGQFAGDKNFFAILGLLLTAVIMPMAGVIAMLLYGGNYGQFFGRLGKIPGFLSALLMISLLGPLGSTPRCIALSYTTLKNSFLALSPVTFSAISCCLILVLTFKKNRILPILSWGLTPALLLSLVSIIALGLFHSSPPESASLSDLAMFIHGLSEGYNTMDLLAAFFFSSTVIGFLKTPIDIKIPLKASLIAAILLAGIYVGFSYVASYHSVGLSIYGKDELLAMIAYKLAGPYAGVLVCCIVALACLTTAIALITAFADFIHKEVFKGKFSYEMTLFFSILMTFFVSTFEFTQISAFLWPILQVCYPGLIVLTFVNIALAWKRRNQVAGY